jgi:hypothetical protein
MDHREIGCVYQLMNDMRLALPRQHAHILLTTEAVVLHVGSRRVFYQGIQPRHIPSICGILYRFTWKTDSIGVWASTCNFPGNDIGEEQVSSTECSPGACPDNAGCTHYVHTNGTNSDQPTCWLKGGDESRGSAMSGDPHARSICGILDLSAPSWSIETPSTSASVSSMQGLFKMKIHFSAAATNDDMGL